jgi:A/G-specific adenine glycosylase
VMIKETYKNPGRRSAHYLRQTSFASSDRKIRGSIIKLLTEKGSLRREKLYELTGSNPMRVDRCLAALEHEGFLLCKAKSICIA